MRGTILTVGSGDGLMDFKVRWQLQFVDAAGIFVASCLDVLDGCCLKDNRVDSMTKCHLNHCDCHPSS